MENKFVLKFETCVEVKGIDNGCIFDVQRGIFFFVSNNTIDLLKMINKQQYKIIKKKFKKNINFIDYFNFFIENEIVHLADNIDHYPVINTDYIKPFWIDILMIEIDNFEVSKKKILSNIDSYGVSHIVLIFKNKTSKNNIQNILNYFEKSKIQTINIVLKYFDLLYEEVINLNNTRIRNITFFNSNDENKSKNIIKTKLSLEDVLLKRVSGYNDMIINIDSYIESSKYNLFYNRRVYIDDEGNILHYFNQKKIFGNIKTSNIIDVIKTDEFNFLWKLTKNNINECKNCKLRLFCPDNRIPFFDGKSYVNELKCNYDDKNNKWVS